MKEFNITGTCIPERNFMVDTTDKINKTLTLIEKGKYFIINRPRQYGKTTSLSLLRRKLLKINIFLPVRISFEGIGESPFETPEKFCPSFLSYLTNDTNIKKNSYSELFLSKIESTNSFGSLSTALTEVLSKIDKKVVLMIDEVDKASNNELFLHFLGMLRDKYLNALDGDDITFHSVILTGVHDVKTLKIKLRPDDERKYNSPWNIAADFDIDMSFNPQEISTMLTEYVNETKINMAIKAVSERIYFWSSGYPFLVSKLCKIVDEKILPKRGNKNWDVNDIDEAAKILLTETNTLFDDMIKNLENDKELFNYINNIVLGNKEYVFEISAPLTNIAYIYGIINYTETRKVKIHNKIFEEKITNYLIAKSETETFYSPVSTTQEPYIKNDGRLDIEKLLLKFQEVIKEKYSNSDLLKSDEFLEKDLRLLFLVFIKPVINGLGFSFKEVEIGAEKRLDIIITFKDEKFIVELKLWYGQKYHDEGKSRLKKYMHAESVHKGYMLIMNKNRNKKFTSEIEDGIFMVYI